MLEIAFSGIRMPILFPMLEKRLIDDDTKCRRNALRADSRNKTLPPLDAIILVVTCGIANIRKTQIESYTNLFHTQPNLKKTGFKKNGLSKASMRLCNR